MEQHTATVIALDSLQSKLHLDEYELDIIGNHLFCMFAVGFDYGKCYGKNAKPIEQYQDQKFIHSYDSFHDAAKAMKVNDRTISKAIKLGYKCKGFYWKLKNK
jgi:hypothetical protein